VAKIGRGKIFSSGQGHLTDVVSTHPEDKEQRNDKNPLEENRQSIESINGLISTAGQIFQNGGPGTEGCPKSHRHPGHGDPLQALQAQALDGRFQQDDSNRHQEENDFRTGQIINHINLREPPDTIR
jgi:hypothetical protein